MRGDRMRHDGRLDDSLARVGGNRAGVVEWANEAFGRLTGIPLAETVNKPVTRFLERAGIELEVVDFVAEHFFEGRRCRLELPFERPDGSSIDLLLDVEALRDEQGEIDRFVAVARARDVERESPATAQGSLEGESPDRSGGRVPTSPTSRSAATSPATATTLAAPVAPAGPAASAEECFDLSAEIERLVRRAAEDGRRASASSPLFDLALDAALAPIPGSRAALVALVSALLASARAALGDSEDAWGVITVTTGRTTAQRRFVSKVHAIPAARGPAAREGQPYLEVHDTGRALPPARLERLRARATVAAERLGATLHVDGTPGCGNQALVLFPSPSPATATNASSRPVSGRAQARYMPPFAAKI